VRIRRISVCYEGNRAMTFIPEAGEEFFIMGSCAGSHLAFGQAVELLTDDGVTLAALALQAGPVGYRNLAA
jgi:hypothetical protein